MVIGVLGSNTSPMEAGTIGFIYLRELPSTGGLSVLEHQLFLNITISNDRQKWTSNCICITLPKIIVLSIFYNYITKDMYKYIRYQSTYFQFTSTFCR